MMIIKPLTVNTNSTKNGRKHNLGDAAVFGNDLIGGSSPRVVGRVQYVGPTVPNLTLVIATPAFKPAIDNRAGVTRANGKVRDAAIRCDGRNGNGRAREIPVDRVIISVA